MWTRILLTHRHIYIAQTILFNCKKNAKKRCPIVKSRHSMEYVPPLPLYIGLNVHTQTRSRKLIMELHAMGLSVSYDWIMQLENQLATTVCEDKEKKGVVCPAQLRKLLFTVGALDNLDHNPSNTTAQGSFHGTGISLFQVKYGMSPGWNKPSLLRSKSKTCVTRQLHCCASCCTEKGECYGTQTTQ